MENADYHIRIQELVGRIGGDVLRTCAQPGRRLAAAALHNVVSVWSDRGTLRKRLLPPVQRLLARAVKAPARPSPPTPTTLPADVAGLLTELCILINEARAQSEPGQDPNRGEKLRAFLENMDFGELMAAVRGSNPYVLEAVETFNRELWKYPAKVICIVASLASIANTGLGSLSRLVRPLTASLGPDLTTDIILSIVRYIRAEEAGDLVQTLSEVTRRFQTGSLLLSRAGKPLFQTELTGALKTFTERLDPEVIAKARIALADLSESAGNAFREAVNGRPELFKAWIESYSAARNPRTRSRMKAASEFESVDAAVFERALADLDVQTMADIANTVLRTVIRLHSERPSLLAGLARTWGYSLDTDALREAAEHLMPEIVEALRPAAEAVLPAVIQGVTDLLSSLDNEVLAPLRATAAAMEGGAQ